MPLNRISRKKLARLGYDPDGYPMPYSTLSPVSAKRQAAVGNGLPQVLRRPAGRYTGPDKVTVEVVWLRDEGRCALCGDPISGERGWDWSVSHRRPRRDRSDRRPDTNLPSNLVLLHGSATSPSCHFRVESRRAEAYASGQLLRDGDVPAQVAIEHAVHGVVYLSDDGAIAYEPPEHAA